MNTKAIAFLAVVVVVVGGWWMFKQSGTDLTENLNVVDTPTQDEVTVREFTISAGSYFFNPKVMEVNKGDTVKITLVNSGGLHDLVIDEFNARTKQLQSGQSETITFVADKAGSFEYYCSVGSHRAMGMKGTLTVK